MNKEQMKWKLMGARMERKAQLRKLRALHRAYSDNVAVKGVLKTMIDWTLQRNERYNKRRGGLQGTLRRVFGRCVILLISLPFFYGCTLIPSERTNQASVKATDHISAENSVSAHRQIQPEVPMAEFRTYDGTNKISEVVLPGAAVAATTKSTSGQNAFSRGDLSGTNAVSIPLGSKLILIGVGLLAIIGALLLAWKYVKSTSVGAGIQLGDQILKRQIDRLYDRVATSSDKKEQAGILNDIASLEADRGKLNNPKAPK